MFNETTAVAMKRRNKHAPTTIEILVPSKGVIRKKILAAHLFPCGGGVKYLHRSPASRRRRPKGSLEFESVKYGRESHGTWTRE
jgi:hypothetical protein